MFLVYLLSSRPFGTLYVGMTDDLLRRVWEHNPLKNGYREGWDLFLRHVVEDTPFPSPLIEGAKGVQLAEACHQSNRERRWIDLPPLTL